MKTGYMNEAWEQFVEASGLTPGSVPHQMMRAAFYGGAIALFSLQHTRLGPGDDATEEDITFMDGLALELEDYMGQCFAGRKDRHR